MKNEVIIIVLISCVFAVAMVPRERRAVNTEEEEHARSTQQPPSASTNAKTREICAPHTPCAWSMYKPIIRVLEVNITNNYCECGPGLACVVDDDDISASAYVYRCRKPDEGKHIFTR